MQLVAANIHELTDGRMARPERGFRTCSCAKCDRGKDHDQEQQSGEAAALHPFAAYHRAVAEAIVKLLKK